MYIHIYIYIYIYIILQGDLCAHAQGLLRHQEVRRGGHGATSYTANFRTRILDFRGLDSSIVLISRGGIPRPIGNFPESLTRGILLGIILVGRFSAVSIGRCPDSGLKPQTFREITYGPGNATP